MGNANNCGTKRLVSMGLSKRCPLDRSSRIGFGSTTCMANVCFFGSGVRTTGTGKTTMAAPRTDGIKPGSGAAEPQASPLNRTRGRSLGNESELVRGRPSLPLKEKWSVFRFDTLGFRGG